MSRPIVPVEAVGVIEAARIVLDRWDATEQVTATIAESFEGVDAFDRAVAQLRATFELYAAAYPRDPMSADIARPLGFCALRSVENPSVYCVRPSGHERGHQYGTAHL